MGLFDSKRAEFTDRRKAHKRFWNRYDRPPRREYWDNIVMRRDKLVPQDVRERKGSFFTPRQWVELSQTTWHVNWARTGRMSTRCGTAPPALATCS